MLLDHRIFKINIGIGFYMVSFKQKDFDLES